MKEASTSSRRNFLLFAAGGFAAIPFLPSGASGAPGRFEFNKSPPEWRQALGPQRYSILREGGTERPGSSILNKEKRKGTYACAGCGLSLFASTTKFESGTGWPSFYRALPNAVTTRKDNLLGMRRTEVLCRRCGGHLGHVFDDGPKPTGLRYCMNGLAMIFRPA